MSFHFASYLAGLIEGDGCILVPSLKYNAHGRLNYPSIQLSFASKDLPLALLIQKNLSFGSIQKIKGKRAYTFFINCRHGLIFTSNLINGYMRTPKIYELHSLITWLNQFFDLSSQILLLPLDSSSFSTNSWLAGFIDADGHFFVRCISFSKFPSGEKKKYIKVECRFELEQSQYSKHGLSLYNIMFQIAQFLNTTVKLVHLSQKSSTFRLRTLNISSNQLLINYLSSHPLFSSKYLDYLDWFEIFKLFVAKKHLTPEGLFIIQNLKTQMNNQRQIFTWNHLNIF